MKQIIKKICEEIITFFKSKEVQISLIVIASILSLLLIINTYVVLSVNTRIITDDNYKSIGYTQSIVV